MKISDLTGLSKPLTRLIEVISKGAGNVSASYLIKKKADAKAYEIRTITNALKDVGVESSSPVVYDAGEIQAWSEGEDRQLE